MDAGLPSGTVTFFFSDVEGSTRLLHELGADRYAEVLAEHRRLVRAACSERGGVEVDTQGDALFVAFASAPAAVDAALAAQGALEPLGVRIRVGVHTGTPLVTSEGYVGVDVHRAARIAAAAHGGQVVVSSATAALDGRGCLRDLGEHRLKDLAAPERLYQAGAGEFPSLRALYRTNLPVVTTPLVGRRRELAALAATLGERPVLVTLTGPGGTGKTRLAVHAAAGAADRFPDGVWWVPLVAVTDSAAVRHATAAAVQCAPEQLASRLAGRASLVVLDNVEHLLPGAALEVSKLVAETPGCSWLVTSREALRLSAEREHPVAALDPVDARELFLARAAARGVQLLPTLALDELCALLDGLPLAIELAAARSSVFSIEQLAERLGDRLDLFRGARDADPRHQTLRATIQWSWSLLNHHERDVLARLSVFPAGARHEEAARVAGADPDVLESLLDKSMLRRRDDPDGAPRFWLLETIRQFAAEQLEASNETAATIDAHTAWVMDLLRDEQPSAERPMHEVTEIATWHLPDVAAALERVGTIDPLALTEVGWSLFKAPDVLLAHAAALESSSAPSLGLVLALTCLAGVCGRRGDAHRAASISELALTRARALDDPYAVAVATIGMEKAGGGRHPALLTLRREAMAIPAIRDERWPHEKAFLLGAAFNEAQLQCDFARAEEVALKMHRLFSIGVGGWVVGVLEAADSAIEQGAYARAADYILRALPDVIRNQHFQAVPELLWATAPLAARTEQPAAAARLMGALDLHQAGDIGYGVESPEATAYMNQTKSRLVAALGDAQYKRLTKEGARLSTRDALILAGDVANTVLSLNANRDEYGT